MVIGSRSKRTTRVAAVLSGVINAVLVADSVSSQLIPILLCFSPPFLTAPLLPFSVLFLLFCFSVAHMRTRGSTVNIFD
jgi:hypothetical protein